MPRRSKDEAQETRAKILSHALTLFVKNGYERTTFTDIAERLKMTKGAVYWHFESKEALLIALVNDMLSRFEAHITSQIPKDELTFSRMAEIMAERGVAVADDKTGRDYFLFLKTQVKWGDASMTKVRDSLIAGTKCGPYMAFRKAVVNDRVAGRVRAEVDPDEVAAICMAAWDGLVQGRIDGFLMCDLGTALRHAFEGVWLSIEKR